MFILVLFQVHKSEPKIAKISQSKILISVKYKESFSNDMLCMFAKLQHNPTILFWEVEIRREISQQEQQEG